ncbi:MAG: pyridoxal 4-dehydrogenase [Alphaproteobacteria bacterium]|nr:pyridoxal 4-dehydrogenase [Alphaproteobacteria bacterium]|tara:strand:- start:1908 stop:2921 length:1014 start_codon:yes stop_codon:yes gene_type:complete
MQVEERRRLGRTDVELTVLGLGGAPLGNFQAPVDEDDALATIDLAYQSGIRLFDVAPQYGHGLAEHRFGHVLRRYARDSYVLTTKVGRMCIPDAGVARDGLFHDPLPFRLQDIYTREAILRSIEDSYQRLGIVEIDALYIHNIDAALHSPDELEAFFKQAMDEAFPALAELRDQGVIKAIGAGNNYTEMCERFARAADFDCFLLAGRYSLLEQGPLDTFFPLCEERGIGIVMGGPFNSGVLATGAVPGATYNYLPATEEVLDRVRVIEGVCAEYGVPLAAAALQFPLAHPVVASVITGSRTPDELTANLAAFRHDIPAEFWAALRDRELIDPRSPLP